SGIRRAITTNATAGPTSRAKRKSRRSLAPTTALATATAIRSTLEADAGTDRPVGHHRLAGTQGHRPRRAAGGDLDAVIQRDEVVGRVALEDHVAQAPVQLVAAAGRRRPGGCGGDLDVLELDREQDAVPRF